MEPKAALGDLFFMMINGRQFLPTPNSFSCHYSLTFLCSVLFVPCLRKPQTQWRVLLDHCPASSLGMDLQMLDALSGPESCSPDVHSSLYHPFLALMSTTTLWCPRILVNRRMENRVAGSQGSLRILTVMMMWTVTISTGHL